VPREKNAFGSYAELSTTDAASEPTNTAAIMAGTAHDRRSSATRMSSSGRKT
jgi:hypothetical protein